MRLTFSAFSSEMNKAYEVKTGDEEDNCVTTSSSDRSTRPRGPILQEMVDNVSESSDSSSSDIEVPNDSPCPEYRVVAQMVENADEYEQLEGEISILCPAREPEVRI